jgi:hypothetical protein
MCNAAALCIRQFVSERVRSAEHIPVPPERHKLDLQQIMQSSHTQGKATVMQ